MWNLFLFLAIAQLWFFGCGVTTRLIGVPLEGVEERWRNEVEVDGEDSSADAVVLLGGGMGVHDGCGRPEIFSGADRVWTAARAFKAGRAPIMTVSGGGAAGELAFLADMGVDTNRVVVLERARNTEEEAALIAGAIKEVKVRGEGEGEGEKVKVRGEGEGGKVKVKVRGEGEGGKVKVRGEGERRNGPPKILLVTSAWHMPRARMLFERAGFEVVAVPTDYEMHHAAERPIRFGDFSPDAEALVRNSYAVKEWVARGCYWAKAALRK